MDNQSINASIGDNQNLHLLSDNKRQSCFKTIPKRYILALFAFFGYFFAYILRANLSVAIVQMSQKTIEEQSLSGNNGNSTNNANDNLKWSTSLQGYILSSFFYGYIVTQLPAGYLTNKYGGKTFFGAGIGVCALLSLFIPLAARLGAAFVIILRILQGLTQGFIFPAMHCMWAKWSPPLERSRLTTFALSGSYVGTVAALSLGGVIGKEINWESIFYIFGGIAVIWSVLWFAFVHESPGVHKTILLEEKNYVQTSITHYASLKVPYSAMLKSSAVWAIVCAHFAENWGFYTLLTELPTFMSDTFNYKIDKAGLISSLPYLTMAIVLYASGYVSDYLIEKRKFNITHVRKGFCSTGLAIQCLFMFLITAMSSASVDAIIAFVTLAIGFGGMAWASFGVNQLDIGSGYANVIMSISNFFASIPGILSPIITGHIIESKLKSDWNTVFYIAATIFLIGGVIYFIFGSAELQTWAIQASNYDNIAGNSNNNNSISFTSFPSVNESVTNESFGGGNQTSDNNTTDKPTRDFNTQKDE